MNFLFQNPLWFLGALVAVPLLAHLFSRTRPRRREFPSLRLLREAIRLVSRVRQPRDRWLLILRTLAMLAIVFAFLQPWLFSRFSLGGGATRTTILVVDVSASMGYADGPRTRLAQAASAAEEILSSLPANGRAGIVWVQGQAASVLPEPGPNLDYLRQSLRQAVARPEAGDIAGALALARQQLASAEGAREVVIISDFQKSAWQGVSLEMPPGIQKTLIAVGQDDVANVALAGLSLEPARPVAGQPAQVTCRVRNFSGEPRRVTVYLDAGESRLSQVVEIAAWGETLAVIPVKFPAEGLVPVKASLTEDRFPGDDIRHALADVRGALQVSVAGPTDDATARIWTRALQSLEGVAVRRLTPGELGAPDRAEVLFLAAWDGRTSAVLTEQLRRGGGLVVQPAEGFDQAAARAALGLPSAAAAESPLAIEIRDTPGWGLRVADEEHPAIAIFARGAYGDPARGSFSRRLAAPAFLSGRPLLSFEDERPALAFLNSGSDQRRSVVAWWNLDLGASDWANRSTFIPFFGEFLRYVASRSATPMVRTTESGGLLRHDLTLAIDPAEVRLLNERDQAIPMAAESPRTPGLLVSTAPVVPGSYRWMAEGGVLDRAVVNFPEIESDLRRLNTAELQKSGGNVIANDARARLGDLRAGRPLWAWCLAAAALFLLVEGWCAWRFPSKSGSAISSSTLSPKPREDFASV